MFHKAFKDFAGRFYVWRNTTNKQPTPGAEAFAFTREMLPLYDWKGPGEIVRSQFGAFSAQVFVPQSVVPTGLAGIAAGQIALGQLMSNPPDVSATSNIS